MSHEKDTFICPMHPEIRANEAGSCSKCGMALVTESRDAKPEKLPDAPAPDGYAPVNV